jgi:S1-C subfamily serine protease
MTRRSFPSRAPLAPIGLLCLLIAAAPGAPSRAFAAAPITDASRRDAVVQVVETTAPSVVSVTTEQVVRSSPFGSSRSFFENFFQGLEPRQRLEQASLGSGVIVDGKGHVLTNEHVIRGAARVTVGLSDDREVE